MMDVGVRLVVDNAVQVVETRIDALEELGGARTTWTWAFLDDGSLIEDAPRGRFRYDGHRVLDRAHPLHQHLVAQDGVLVRFEARVRAGRASAEPTFVTIEAQEYRVRATGNATLSLRGATPTLAAWSIAGATAEEPVYFILEAVEGHEVALGLWTGSLCLSFGRPAAWHVYSPH